ncbi:hypothetical protein Emag_007625 [Eimeria magna]
MGASGGPGGPRCTRGPPLTKCYHFVQSTRGPPFGFYLDELASALFSPFFSLLRGGHVPRTLLELKAGPLGASPPAVRAPLTPSTQHDSGAFLWGPHVPTIDAKTHACAHFIVRHLEPRGPPEGPYSGSAWGPPGKPMEGPHRGREIVLTPLSVVAAALSGVLTDAEFLGAHLRSDPAAAATATAAAAGAGGSSSSGGLHPFSNKDTAAPQKAFGGPPDRVSVKRGPPNNSPFQSTGIRRRLDELKHRQPQLRQQQPPPQQQQQQEQQQQSSTPTGAPIRHKGGPPTREGVAPSRPSGDSFATHLLLLRFSAAVSSSSSSSSKRVTWDEVMRLVSVETIQQQQQQQQQPPDSRSVSSAFSPSGGPPRGPPRRNISTPNASPLLQQQQQQQQRQQQQQKVRCVFVGIRGITVTGLPSIPANCLSAFPPCSAEVYAQLQASSSSSSSRCLLPALLLEAAAAALGQKESTSPDTATAAVPATADAAAAAPAAAATTIAAADACEAPSRAPKLLRVGGACNSRERRAAAAAAASLRRHVWQLAQQQGQQHQPQQQQLLLGGTRLPVLLETIAENTQSIQRAPDRLTDECSSSSSSSSTDCSSSEEEAEACPSHLLKLPHKQEQQQKTSPTATAAAAAAAAAAAGTAGDSFEKGEETADEGAAFNREPHAEGKKGPHRWGPPGSPAELPLSLSDPWEAFDEYEEDLEAMAALCRLRRRPFRVKAATRAATGAAEKESPLASPSAPATAETTTTTAAAAAARRTAAAAAAAKKAKATLKRSSLRRHEGWATSRVFSTEDEARQFVRAFGFNTKTCWGVCLYGLHSKLLETYQAGSTAVSLFACGHHAGCLAKMRIRVPSKKEKIQVERNAQPHKHA